jgi:hypothetical protein
MLISQVVRPTIALREMIQFSGSSTPLLRDLEPDALLDDQLRELRTDPYAFRYYLEAAHKYVENDSTLLALHNLFDPRLRRMLRDIALYHARKTPSIDSANDLLILARTERYLSSDNPDFSFYADASTVLTKTFPSFAALLKYREFEQRLRISPATANVDILLDAADRLRFSGELNGYYDCICRLATNQAFLGNIDSARGMLLSALQNLLSHGYITDSAIRRSVADPHSGQIAWILRALSRVDIQKSELEDRAGPKLAALNNALAWNQSAYRMYKALGIQHGVANAFRERGEIEQQRENLGEEKYPESWLWFLRAVEYYKAVGDPHHEAECRQLAITAIENLLSSRGFTASGLEEVLEKAPKRDAPPRLSFNERPFFRGHTEISYSGARPVVESPSFDQTYKPEHTDEIMQEMEDESLGELIALVRNTPRERRPALKQLITTFASDHDKETGEAIPPRRRGRPRQTEPQLAVEGTDESSTAGLTSEMVRTAQEVFGASAKIPARRYHKSRSGPEFSDDQLKSRDLLSVADAICNHMKARKALTPEERAMWNKAKRFTYHARKHH